MAGTAVVAIPEEVALLEGQTLFRPVRRQGFNYLLLNETLICGEAESLSP